MPLVGIFIVIAWGTDLARVCDATGGAGREWPVGARAGAVATVLALATLARVQTATGRTASRAGSTRWT